MKGQLAALCVWVLYSTLYNSIQGYIYSSMSFPMAVSKKFFFFFGSFIYLPSPQTAHSLNWGTIIFSFFAIFILKVCPIDIAGPVSTIFCTVAFFWFVVLHLDLEFMGTEDILATITCMTVNRPLMWWHELFTAMIPQCAPQLININSAYPIKQCPNINSGYKIAPKFHVVSIHV